MFRAEMKPIHSHPLGKEKNLFWVEAEFKYLWKEKCEKKNTLKTWKQNCSIVSKSKARVWFSQSLSAASLMTGWTEVQSSGDLHLPTEDYWLSLGSQGAW